MYPLRPIILFNTFEVVWELRQALELLLKAKLELQLIISESTVLNRNILYFSIIVPTVSKSLDRSNDNLTKKTSREHWELIFHMQTYFDPTCLHAGTKRCSVVVRV